MQQNTGYLTRSPSSSPSLAPVDSSPPSSPSLPAISTPPASPGTKDPFAGSTKSIKRPRMYERHASNRSLGVIDASDAEDGDTHVLTRPGVLLAKDAHADTTPTRQVRVVDPFSGTAKREWRPPTHEKKMKRVASSSSPHPSTSSSQAYAYKSSPVCVSPTPKHPAMGMNLDDPDDFQLSDGELEHLDLPTKPKSREELEEKLWDDAISGAIDKLNGVIDLSGTSLAKGPITHIPPSIADLEGFVVLPSTHIPTSAPPSPTLSPTLPSAKPLVPLSSFSSSRPFTRATTLPAAVFNEAFFRSKDGERLRGTPAARAASLQNVGQQPTTQLRRREIHMFLANNSISQLPPELFCVTTLTVLSLRSNALTSIPPQIAQLKALQELNLAQNKLRWLPAEMMGMHLTKLTVSGNPWVQPPTPPPQASTTAPVTSSRSTQGSKRPVTDTIVHFKVAPLTEICLRVLVAPYNATTFSSTSHFTADSTSSPPRHPDIEPPSKPLSVLEASYALPLTEDLLISPSVLATLRACVPAAVSRPVEDRIPTKVQRGETRKDVHSRAALGGADADVDEESGCEKGDAEDLFDPRHRAALNLNAGPPALVVGREDTMGVSICPSPMHREKIESGGEGEGNWHEGHVPVFVHPAEERWTWEETVAGVHVGAEGVDGVSVGAGVPVRWRGCSRGCLAFLDPLEPPPQQPQVQVQDAHVGMQGEEEFVSDLNVEAGRDEDVEMEDVMGVEGLRFEGGLADPEDFEDAF